MNTLYRPTNRDYIFFWHENDTNGRFSQWHVSPFRVDGVRYYSCEQYVMAQKAKLFGDFELYQRILEEEDPVVCRAYGRQIRSFDQKIWEKHLQEILFRGNLEKFSQNRALRKALLATGNATLAEANPMDPILGIGMTASDPFAMDQRYWQGRNLLGKTLMQVRSTLGEQKNDPKKALGIA